jgi:hypothetical protein
VKTFLLFVVRPLALVWFYVVKIVIVFHWTAVRDIGMAVADEFAAVSKADLDDWTR